MTTPTAVTEAMVEAAARVVAYRAGEDFDHVGEFTQGILLDTQRAALEAALAAPGPDEGAEAVGYVSASVAEHLRAGGHATTTITAHQAMLDDAAIYLCPQSPAQPKVMHTCSYQCDRPACIKAQRDELAARHAPEASAEDAASERTAREALAAEVERAKAVTMVAGAYIGAVKTEIDAIRLMDETGRLPLAVEQPAPPVRLVSSQRA